MSHFQLQAIAILLALFFASACAPSTFPVQSAVKLRGQKNHRNAPRHQKNCFGRFQTDPRVELPNDSPDLGTPVVNAYYVTEAQCPFGAVKANWDFAGFNLLLMRGFRCALTWYKYLALLQKIVHGVCQRVLKVLSSGVGVP